MPTDPSSAYPTLANLIGAYFHQDVDLEAATIPEVLHSFTRSTWEEDQRRLAAELDRFEAEHRGDLDAAFRRVFDAEVDPVPRGGDVAAFFAMVRAILADPESYRRFESGPDFR